MEKPSAGKFAAIGAGVLGAAVMLDPAKMWLSGGNLFLSRAAVFAAYLALQAPILRAYLSGGDGGDDGATGRCGGGGGVWSACRAPLWWVPRRPGALVDQPSPRGRS